MRKQIAFVTLIVVSSFLMGCSALKAIGNPDTPENAVRMVVDHAKEVQEALAKAPDAAAFREINDLLADPEKFLAQQAVVPEPTNVEAVPDRVALYKYPGATAMLKHNIEAADTVRYTEWEIEHPLLPGGKTVFWSLRVCPDGLPKHNGDEKRCAQIYHGIKVDGSQTVRFYPITVNGQYMGLVLVYDPKEQWAGRIIRFDCAVPFILGMASC